MPVPIRTARRPVRGRFLPLVVLVWLALTTVAPPASGSEATFSEGVVTLGSTAAGGDVQVSSISIERTVRAAGGGQVAVDYTVSYSGPGGELEYVVADAEFGCVLAFRAVAGPRTMRCVR